MPNDSETLLRFLLSRRSIRKFKAKEVDMETIKRILDVARYAPSARNLQPWIFIVVTDREIRMKLAEIQPGAQPIKNAPVCIAVACDKTASPITYHVDCANAAMYIMLAAHALGLGSVWINALRNIEKVRQILGIPPNYVPITIIALGYPDESPEPRPRKSLGEIAFLNAYGRKLQS